jgi:hypothetical protein
MENEFYPQFWVILPIGFGNFIHSHGRNLQTGEFVATIQ